MAPVPPNSLPIAPKGRAAAASSSCRLLARASTASLSVSIGASLRCASIPPLAQRCQESLIGERTGSDDRVDWLLPSTRDSQARIVTRSS
ncbi:hypothetical protein [Shinella sp.]|uniref:hypothetical protein n=1 Tax=Shinella sp. TaxID=1870904 RepID=UPI0029B135B6|nr:hypothetical protein [Shinella sp.]MDX3978129.1 hypothetical protein [Shinella sp.]